jgi:diguanylate cyclase (GGDEF)-like protein/PAS domain S-box-containing protein
VKLLGHDPEELAYVLADAMGHLREAVVITTAELDPPGPEIVYVNDSYCQLTGYAREELIGKTPRIMQGPKTDRHELDRLRRQLSLGKPFDGEIVNYRKDGSEYVIEWHIVPLRNDAREITHWIASQRDITDRKVLEGELRYQALHDPLTNLPNRVLFMDRLEHALSLADRERRLSAVLFVDLDNFKLVNDSVGHEAGDKLLVQVAERLRTSLRAEDTVARFGGDEFGILLEGVPGPSYVADLAERVIESLRQPFVLEGREFAVTCSIGTALAASSHDRVREMPRRADLAMYEAKRKGKIHFARELLRKADLAMYEAKRKGKGCYQMFDPDINTHT